MSALQLNDGKPKVLVLLAAFEGEVWIGDQLASIEAQSDVEVTVVLSDDGTNDGMRAALEPFAENGKLRVIRPEAPTGSAAQNFFFLIRYASSEGFDFVALSDQDDFWYPDKIFRACRALATQRAGGYSSAVIAAWSNGKRSYLRQTCARKRLDFIFEGAGQGCTFVMTTPFYEKVRNFLLEHPNLVTQLHYHDWTIYALANSWNVGWIFDPTPTMLYRQHGANDTGARSSFSAIRRRLRLIRSGWYRIQLIAIADVCVAAAGQDQDIILYWRSLLASEDSISRRARVALFCARNGRRRYSDTFVLILSALLGWI